MQEEFEDERPVPRQVPLEIIDILVTFAPEIFVRFSLCPCLVQPLWMHLHHQYVFIIAAVEDTDAAALRESLHVTPEKVVVEFLRRRLLEAEHLTALWIHARHDVTNGAVLAGGVHCLKNQ